jgi:AAA15 family ATPase/GTPase
MLRRLRINNFRSFIDFEIKFERNFHAIIGRNNSGKTNLIDTIEFLSKLAQNLNIFNVIERMGGFDKILYFGAEEPR